ncbi:hypothetical protein Tco_0458832 [Tanacetum coccineum]
MLAGDSLNKQYIGVLMALAGYPHHVDVLHVMAPQSSPCRRAAGVSSSLSGCAVGDGSSPCGRAAGIGCDSSPCELTAGDGSSPCRRAADIGSLTIRTLTVANFGTGEKV